MDQSHLEWLENYSSKLRHMHLAKEAIEIAVEQPQCTPTAERLSVGSSRLSAAGDWERYAASPNRHQHGFSELSFNRTLTILRTGRRMREST